MSEESKREEEFANLWYNDLGMCGCGNPEAVKEFLYKLMVHQTLSGIEPFNYEEWDAERKKIITDTDPHTIFEFVFHVLEHTDFAMHGGSVYGSWLSDKGIRLVELLK